MGLFSAQTRVVSNGRTAIHIPLTNDAKSRTKAVSMVQAWKIYQTRGEVR